MKKFLATAIVLFLVISIFTGCKNEYPPSLWDEDEPIGDTPAINSIVPPDSFYAGVGEMTINGQNFSPQKEDNLVFFDGNRAEVVTASETQLTIKTPNIVGDSLQIKVAVYEAVLFSEPAYYKLKAAVAVFGTFLPDDMTYGIACDLAGNVYVSVDGTVDAIKKIDPDGNTSEYTVTTFTKANGMKMGPGDTLYCAVVHGRLKKISIIAPDGTESIFVSLTPRPQDLDFDANGNLWVVAEDDVLCVKPDGTTNTIATFPVDLLTVRVYNGYVYVAGENTSEKKIWRCEIQGDSLGAPEVVLDVAAATWLEGASIQSFTFSQDGEIYLGTNHEPDAIFIYRPADGSNEVLFPGLIGSSIYGLSWGEGPYLFATRQFGTTSEVLKIDVGKRGAPYYGRQL